ncbi:MAG TPA: pyridoxal-phosphate dependent enzyme [Solirubrobacter sp.]|nr:pyridoxal-phosphate dependent enzyme [Solirubrobacter sp.]
MTSWNGETGAAPPAGDSRLRCQVLTDAGWTILVLEGDLDFTHMDTARKALHGLTVPRRGRLALDLRGLGFMDTTGVRLVLQAMQRAEECDADFALVRGPYEVQHVLELVGLTDQLKIVRDPAELVRAPRAAAVLVEPAVVAVPRPRADPRGRRRCGDVLDAIGDTPLVELTHLAPETGARLWAKLESLNPTGSVKDRVARALIEDAEARGAIRPGQTILEATSGNTGIALAMICARKGYPLTVVMPDNVTPERTEMLRMYGAEIVYSPGPGGSNGAIALARSMAEADGAYYMPYQFGNAANPLAHYNGTGAEILRDLGDVAAFVGGLGTGGTLMGTGRRLREALGPATKIVAVEPLPGELVQGLRSLADGFIPPIVDLSLLDRKICVANRDAIAWTRRLLDQEGIFAGVSSGAIASVAVRIARELGGGNVVFMVCDDGWKYLSSGLYTRPLEEVAGVDETAWW